MFKRIIGCFLAATLLLISLPTTAFALTEVALYGDANGDGEVDPLDVLALKQYIVGNIDAEKDFSITNADVNADGEIDAIDVLMIKQSIAGTDILLGPAIVSVTFYDGDRLIDTLTGRKGQPLGKGPTTEKTSRADAVFAGWFTDPEFTTPFYADSPLAGDTEVYAKYDVLERSELTLTSFAQTDVGTDVAFTVVGDGDINGIELAAKDGSDPVELNISGNNPYTVTAKDGFTAGASYELTLPEGLCFVGTSGQTLPETIRTASFTVKKEAVANLKMSEHAKYVQNADPSLLTAGSTVTLTGAANGDIICFYKNTSPEDRDYKSGNAYADDPETWFKVSAVNGSTVTLSPLDESDSAKLYELSDNFPVSGALPAGDTGVLTLDGNDDDGYALDTDFYRQMVEEGVSADLAYAKSRISVGDFISIYVSSDDIDGDDDIYFGKITAYDSNSGEITYIKSSAAEIEASMDLYIQPVLEGDDLISEEAKEKIEQTVLEQLRESGFAEDAGFLLADLATRTDGFRNMDGAQILLADENGNPLSDDEIALLNLGKSFEIADGIGLTVEIITSGDQLHFMDKGSVQLSIGIDAEFEIEVEDGKIVIDLSATFVQELGIGITATGSLVKKEILGIPVPVGVKVGSSVDILSYTAVRVDVTAYTVAEEDKPLWEQLKEVATNPEKLVDVLPAGDKFAKVKEGLETVGDVFDKIDEVKEKIEQVRDDVERSKGYADDLVMLWDMVGQMQTSDLPTKEKWEEMGKTLGKTNVSKDLMDMLGLATETELDADRYTDGLEDLLGRYSEMLSRETDWVELVRQEICMNEYRYCGMVIYIKADFVVRADINIAMGTSIQYQVGKRYSFWMKIGLFLPEAGSSTMDLVDEEFAFQFYIMGKLGVKMGIEATVGFAVGTSKAARVGVHLELGPYVKLYGFFIYEYERSREANTSVWKSDEHMAGALYLDFGLYLIVGIDASALGDLFEVSYDFIDAEYPLLEAGQKKYPYAFHYEPIEGELVQIRDEDGNNNNGVTMTLPDEYRAVSYCNLENGCFGATPFDWNCYNYSFSNPAFSIDGNGVISVNVPENTRYMECDLTLTYKYGKLAFSTYDMQVTIPLVWTNLASAELNQYYTASVRVGSNADGYDTVWSTRVRKNQEFTLPTEAELKTLIGYNDAIYSSLSFPDAGKTEIIIDNKTYDCSVVYTDYAVTVNGIQNADGSTRSEVLHTTYGGIFDFSALTDTGTDRAGDVETAAYKAFAGVSTKVAVTANGQTQVIDLGQPITGRVAEAIRGGSITATAVYVDDSVLVTYVFSGIDVPDYSERIRKGTASDYDFPSVASEKGMAVKSVAPTLGKVKFTTVYFVECGKIEGPSFTLSFEENGGGAVSDIIRVGGSLIGNLPDPEKTGYVFGGWYTDVGLTKEFAAKLMPGENTTLHARWTADEFIITFNVNGGNALDDGEMTKTVTYDGTYGILPTPTKSGCGFIGWFTLPDGGTEVTAADKVAITQGQTVYAHFKVLKEIPAAAFDFGSAETATYSKGTEHETVFVFDAGSESFRQNEFTFKYMRQGNDEYETAKPINAGTYNVTVSRPEDNEYAKFEYTYTGVITVNKAIRTIDTVAFEVEETGYTYFRLKYIAGSIDDISADAKMSYTTGSQISETGSGYIGSLLPETEYSVVIQVTGDPNYEDASAVNAVKVSTLAAPTDSWKDYTEPFTVSDNKATITTGGQLAYFAEQVTGGNTYSGVTITLANDIDLKGHKWVAIGVTTGPTFGGTLDGNGNSIYNLYMHDTSTQVALFYKIDNAILLNIVLNDSYIYGGMAGGIVSSSYNSTINNCVNNARVISTAYWGGGIVALSTETVIVNCVNNGIISGEANVGGIVGINQSGSLICNSVNTGSVNGTDTIGGIVGENSGGDDRVYNCYTIGTVTGGKDYTGAVCGRNTKNDGEVHQCYYLSGSATGNGSSRNATGKDNGSIADSDKGTKTAYFTSPSSVLSQNCEEGIGDTDLTTALKAWVTRCGMQYGAVQWVAGPDGYPLPVGTVN